MTVPSRTRVSDPASTRPPSGRARSAGPVQRLADALDQLASAAGAGCLLSGPDGRLVAHRLVEDCPGLTDHILSGQTSSLHARLTRRRTAGLLAGAPVFEGVLCGQPAAVINPRYDGRELGELWLLLAQDRTLSLDVLADPVERLVDALLGADTAADPDAALLDGSPLPPQLADADRFWVCRLVTAARLASVVGAVPASGRDLHTLAIRSGDQLYLLVAASAALDDDTVTRRLEALREQTAARLRQPLALAVSHVAGADGLRLARRQADAVAAVTRPSEVCVLPSVRSRLVAHHLAGALQAMPDAGPDPLAQLRRRDARTGGDLLLTLRTWLSECCETSASARRLDIHPNTLRNRLQQIELATGLAVRRDMDARLELHLLLQPAAPRD